MGSEKKQRKQENREEHSETIDETEKKSDIDDHTESKVKKRKNDEKLPKQKKVKKTPKSTEKSSSKPVHLDSLQSIFETKNHEDSAFTLFGGDLFPEVLPTPSIHTQPQRLPVLPVSDEIQQKALYFFPHYESPEITAQSLLPVLEEPFYYDRTDDEKRRLWDEKKRELTQDWKKKWKAAQKLKRRVEIRRRL